MNTVAELKKLSDNHLQVRFAKQLGYQHISASGNFGYKCGRQERTPHFSTAIYHLEHLFDGGDTKKQEEYLSLLKEATSESTESETWRCVRATARARVIAFIAWHVNLLTQPETPVS